MGQDPGKLQGMLDNIGTLTDRGGEVTVGDVQDNIGNRAYGALMLLPALIGCTPVAGIPGLPAVLAVIILLIALQLAVGRSSVWLPSMLRDRGLADDRVSDVLDKLRPWARRLDKVFQERFALLTQPPMPQVAAAIVAVFAATIPFVGFIPFAAALPFGAIALLSMALLFRDGAVMAVALVASVAAGWGLWVWLV